MSSFFKIFFASLLALVVFCILVFFLAAGILGALTSQSAPETGKNAVLLINLSETFPDVKVRNPLAAFSKEENYDRPSFYEVVRLIEHATKDSSIKGILLQCGSNGNGFGNGEDIRNALLHFKQSHKFVYAYGKVISQGGYFVANVADKIYCHPQGGVDWRGYAMQYLFLKGALDKLEIEPQIFYAGKFKSATEPFRTKQMTDANRLQSSVILNDLYAHFLVETAAMRKIDTATLHAYANENKVHSAWDAQRLGLVDGLRYEDELQQEIKKQLRISDSKDINFVSIAKYAEAVSLRSYSGGKIALIYAQGDIMDGKGDREMIGSDTYMKLIRKARTDVNIKAIVVRINSGGGSSLASESIWRELSLARKAKPVVVSYGDVSASGAYYFSCNADSIFAQPNTITGSIGVFSIVPNLQSFFDHKLGVTFDNVKTSPDADAMTIAKPLTAAQKQYLQNDVDSIYHVFKSRVAAGRKMEISYVDSIGQGRIWSGRRALDLGLVDRLGGLTDAIDCAARMAKLKEYSLREYPEPASVFDLIMGNTEAATSAHVLKDALGPVGYRTYQQLNRVKSIMGTTQARMPFDCIVE